MLGSISIFGGGKGMVAMPNLSGLSRDAAISAVQSAGLVFASSINVDATSENNGKVVSQSVSSGTLVDYESSITFGVGLYTAPSGPVITFVTDTNPDGSLKVYEVNDGDPFCVTTNSPYIQSQKRKYVYLTYKYIDGVKDTTFTALQTPTSDPVAPTISIAYSTACGYVAPPAVTCTQSSQPWGQWSACSNGYRSRTERQYQTCTDGTSQWVGDYYTVTEACCVSLGTTYSNCTSCVCAYKTCDAVTSTLCGSVTTTHPAVRVSVSCTGGGLGPC